MSNSEDTKLLATAPADSKESKEVKSEVKEAKALKACV